MNEVTAENHELFRPGDTFEKYRIEKLLGRGGMGAVYLVRHNILDTYFALKVLFPDMAQRNQNFVDRFIREAKLACKIKHPNLIMVHDAGQSTANGMYYIVMDYVPGGNVRQLLKRQGALAPAQALSIVRQVASALQAAWEHKMVHRDIKPDNIMFKTDGTIKLADLGIAKSSEDGDPCLTVEASVFGTPSYMSPEQALDSRWVDCRADIYSLGIVFYEMLTGQNPYQGENSIAILSQVLNQCDLPDIRQHLPNLPEKWALLLKDMCKKEVEFRISTPTELLTRLDALPELASSTPLPATGQRNSPEATLPTITAAASTPAVTQPTIAAPSAAPQAATPTATGTSPQPPPPKATGTSPQPPPPKIAPLPPASRKRLIRIAQGLVALLVVAVGIKIMLPESAESSPVAAPSSEPSPRQEPSSRPKTPPAPAKSQVESRPAATPQAHFDLLQPQTAILLGGDTPQLRQLKRDLKHSAWGKKLLFVEAPNFARHQKFIQKLIKAHPCQVILAPAAFYARQNISANSFDTLIQNTAHNLRDAGIPLAFLQESAPNLPQMPQFNTLIRQNCQQHSYPLIDGTQSVSQLTAELNKFLQNK